MFQSTNYRKLKIIKLKTAWITTETINNKDNKKETNPKLKNIWNYFNRFISLLIEIFMLLSLFILIIITLYYFIINLRNTSIRPDCKNSL